jgi:membrane associated rhomboid family serine protease
MGLYDREYSREPQSGYQLSAPQTATMQLLAVTVAVYLLQLVFPQVTEHLRLYADWWRHPWTFYQLLTYGFLHDPVTARAIEPIGHLVINMFVLWMFGREIEARYGRTEFLAFYLAAIVAAGVGWSLIETAAGSAERAAMLGASGGIAAVVALFALNYPHRQVLLMFVIPMPMWVAAVGGLLYDAFGAVHRSDSVVAFTAHLSGAAFGVAYYWFNWRLAPWVAGGSSLFRNRSRPKLRVVREMDDDGGPDDLSRKVDEILQKIQEQGQDSLTWSERRLLEKASRQYQQKRK